MKRKLYINMSSRRLFLLALLLATTFGARAQDSIVGSFEAALESHYFWRGQDYGGNNARVTADVGWKGFHFELFGLTLLSENNPANEINLSFYYEWNDLSFGLTDYWFGKGSYFQYKSGKTTHLWEGFIGYDFGFLSATWYTNFAGDDGLNNSLNRAYSSYFELKAPFRLAKLEWEGSVGISPWATTTYGNGCFACTNVGLKATKDFLIKQKYHLPVFVGLNANPDNGKLYMLCGLGFHI